MSLNRLGKRRQKTAAGGKGRSRLQNDSATRYSELYRVLIRKIVMKKKQVQSLSELLSGRFPLLSLAGSWILGVLGGSFLIWGVGPAPVQAQGRFSTATDPNQVPTARYGRGEAVDLSLIVEEWRDRYPAIPVFVCSCNADTCGNPEVWPFRSYTRYQPFVALGKANAANNETTGFNCFEMESGARP